MKCAFLEKRSTMVRTTNFPLTRGKPSTESMAQSLHTCSGTGNGCWRPARMQVLDFVLLTNHTTADELKSWMKWCVWTL